LAFNEGYGFFYFKMVNLEQFIFNKKETFIRRAKDLKENYKQSGFQQIIEKEKRRTLNGEKRGREIDIRKGEGLF
jgi:hypothetical protein